MEFLDFIRGATGSIRVRTGNGVPGAAWFAKPCPGKSASRTPSRSFEPSAAAPFSDHRLIKRIGERAGFAFPHGLRAAEICDLEWSQVEFGRSASLHVRRVKNGKPSVHPLPARGGSTSERRMICCHT